MQFGFGIFPCHFFVSRLLLVFLISSRYERIPYKNSKHIINTISQWNRKKIPNVDTWCCFGTFHCSKYRYMQIPCLNYFISWKLNSIRFFTSRFFSRNVIIVTYHSYIVRCWQLIYFFEVRGRFLFEGLWGEAQSNCRIQGHSVRS